LCAQECTEEWGGWECCRSGWGVEPRLEDRESSSLTCHQAGEVRPDREEEGCRLLSPYRPEEAHHDRAYPAEELRLGHQDRREVRQHREEGRPGHAGHHRARACRDHQEVRPCRRPEEERHLCRDRREVRQAQVRLVPSSGQVRPLAPPFQLQLQEVASGSFVRSEW
jgi:hypothetical protein